MSFVWVDGRPTGAATGWGTLPVRGIVEENKGVMEKGGFPIKDGGWQAVPHVATVVVEGKPVWDGELPFPFTTLSVVNTDTLSAALEVGDAAALSFANADVPGGRYTSGGRAQEEDLCRLLPQLHPSLVDSGAYPLRPGSACLTSGLVAVRVPGSYELGPSRGSVSIISAAMPCGTADRRPKGGWLSPESPWAADVRPRLQAVLTAGAVSGRRNLVLGAFGCGAFGNPVRPVAALFAEALAGFGGVFENVVFAVIDPVGTGNLRPFREELRRAFGGKRRK